MDSTAPVREAGAGSNEHETTSPVNAGVAVGPGGENEAASSIAGTDLSVEAGDDYDARNGETSFVAGTDEAANSPMEAADDGDCRNEQTTSIAGTDEAVYSPGEAGDAVCFDHNGDGGDYDDDVDAEQLLREAIASRLPAGSKRRGEPEPVCLLTGHSAVDTCGISTGDLVSVVGPSHVGKTQLLYSLIAGAIAPPPAGRGACVCYFEHLERLDTSRVRRVLRDRLVKCGDFTVPEDRMVTVLDSAIKERLFFYRITTTMQLSVTLYSLLDHLHTRPGTAIDMVLIDGLGAMHYSDMNNNSEAVLMHMLRRLLRSRLVAVVVSECAILETVSVGAKILGISSNTEISDQMPTRPMSFMPHEYAEDMVTHSIVLYFGEDRHRRGALVLRSPSRYSAQTLIASGELIVSSDLVTIQQQSQVMSCSERQ